jgi:hypothetical protein
MILLKYTKCFSNYTILISYFLLISSFLLNHPYRTSMSGSVYSELKTPNNIICVNYSFIHDKNLVILYIITYYYCAP